MKQLNKVEKRIVTTLSETINGRIVYYQFETNETNPNAEMVNFSSTDASGFTLSGSHSIHGGLTLNGQGITSMEDFLLLQTIMATVLKIEANEYTTETEEVQDDSDNG